MFGRRDTRRSVGSSRGVRADLERSIAASEADLAPLLHERGMQRSRHELLKSKFSLPRFSRIFLIKAAVISFAIRVFDASCKAFLAFFIERVPRPKPIPCRAGDPAPPRGGLSERADLAAAVRPVPGKLFLRRRPETVDLSLPPRRRCSV